MDVSKFKDERVHFRNSGVKHGETHLYFRLFEASKVMLTEVVQDENFQEFMKTLSGNDETVQIMEYFLQGFVQQQSCKC